ncbi:hypothetical protein, partial [Amycolatopsis acidiphila]|uniref:hypothetical protein n=1 Tax=Amycolatopsis acidiphila TaxID=715473 RepID=UPI001C93AD1D
MRPAAEVENAPGGRRQAAGRREPGRGGSALAEAARPQHRVPAPVERAGLTGPLLVLGEPVQAIDVDPEQPEVGRVAAADAVVLAAGTHRTRRVSVTRAGPG